MPVGSDPDASRLPVTFRPLGVRVAVVVLGVFLFTVVAVMWVAFPQSVRDQFTLFQRLTVLLFCVGILAAGYALGRSRVTAGEEGLRVVNGYRSRDLTWGQVTGVTLRAGSPWAVLELADGTTAAAMGIQGSDGNRAVAQVRQLRALLAARRGGSAGRSEAGSP